MKHTIIYTIIFGCTFLFGCSTKWNYIDTGTSIGYYDGTMLDYFRNDTWHNWDSIAKVIDKCSPEIKAYFERTDASITFFGPKNIAFEKFFFWSANPSLDVPNYNTASYTCIDEFSQDFCDQIVMSHLYVDGKIMRDDIALVETDDEGENIGGGMVLNMEYGNKLWVWSVKNSFIGVSEAGDIELRAASVEADGHTIVNNLGTIATTNLENKSGVVHALGDQYFIGQLLQN